MSNVIIDLNGARAAARKLSQQQAQAGRYDVCIENLLLDFATHAKAYDADGGRAYREAALALHARIVARMHPDDPRHAAVAKLRALLPEVGR